MVDVVEHLDEPTNTVRRPTLTFIHLDHAGHKSGHGTPEHYASAGVADKLIGEVLAAIQEAGSKNDTLALITADHGANGKGHGGATMAEIEIPTITYVYGLKQTIASACTRSLWELRSTIEAASRSYRLIQHSMKHGGLCDHRRARRTFWLTKPD